MEISVNEKEIINSLQDLKNIQIDLQDLLLTQDETLDKIEDNFYKSDMEIEKGLKELEIGKKYKLSYKTIILGGIIGTSILSPLGGIGIGLGIGGSIGGYLGYIVQN